LGPEMGGNGSRNYSPVENVSNFPHAWHLINREIFFN
jgi:hypothetical protein